MRFFAFPAAAVLLASLPLSGCESSHRPGFDGGGCVTGCPTPPAGCRADERTCDSCGRILCDGIDAGCSPPLCAPPPPGCRLVGTTPCDCGTVVCDDGGACIIDCPGPGPGCYWSGPVTCDPPSCGELVCYDAGCPPIACPAPPPGCHYEAGAPCTCGTLVCDEVTCGAGGGGTFPTFDRSCGTDADCTFGIHQTDCCGNTVAIGMSIGQELRFDGAETACRSMYPACGCPAGPTRTEDGGTAWDPDAIVALCSAGSCATSLR